ncbi:MAG TPA: hypothetical protein VJX30_03570, partial [Terriglobales bacterium]|nr:hypothetical protein [Terriglobales bacterium]
MSSTLATARDDSRASQLMELAIRGLDPMFDPEKKLFCYRLKQTPSGLVREGISQRYTIMTLLGLLRAESAGFQSALNLPATLDRLLSDTTWLNNIGDLGLLLWLCALSSHEHLARFYAMFDLERAFERYPDARGRPTMELSWFLAGLAHASGTGMKQPPPLARLANGTYRLLRANQGAHGIFGHLGRRSSLAGMVRGRVGSFADQVYPIYAMAHFAQVYELKDARQNALQCASAICRLQGPLGQWWWHYDSVTGRVVGHYPVYSVHQHGMAPMALFALQDTCNADFGEQIYKGLGWISGANELRQDLENAAAGVIWRCIHPAKSTSYAARIRTLLGKEQNLGAAEILFECRPYELGWLLYAHARNGSTAIQ